MKRLIITMLLAISMGFLMNTAAFEIDGIHYFIVDEEAKTVGIGSDDFSGCCFAHEWEIDIFDCIPWESTHSTYSGDIVIPEKVMIEGKEYTVTKIFVAAFANAIELMSITMPNTITDVMEGAFYGCSNLKEIKFSNQTRGLRRTTLEGCTSLTKLDFSGIQDYIDYLLDSCPNLRELVLPTEAIYYAIYSWQRTEPCIFYISNPNPPRGIEVYFKGIPEGSILYVPDGAVGNYSECRYSWDFPSIRPMSEAGDNAPVTNPQPFKLSGQSLVATGEDNVEVYDLQGRLMQVVTAGCSTKLAAGIYVLRCGSISEKVIVQ